MESVYCAVRAECYIQFRLFLVFKGSVWVCMMDIDFRLTDCGLGKVHMALGLTQQLIVALCFVKYSFGRVGNIAKNDY
jgi:hypothetical protein